MIQIKDKEKCCGCTACYNVCPLKAIIMKKDEEGFLYPIVDITKCVHCGQCEKVCPVLHREYHKEKTKGYIIRYKDEKSKRIFVEHLRHNKLFAFYHDPADPLNAHLFDKRNDKVKAIQFVATLENIPREKIYTIGDGYNDLSMIEAYNGFAIKNAKYAAKYESLGVYDSVSDLVDDIEKDNAPKKQ